MRPPASSAADRQVSDASAASGQRGLHTAAALPPGTQRAAPRRTPYAPVHGARRSLHTSAHGARRFVPTEPTWSVNKVLMDAMHQDGGASALLNDAQLERLFRLAALHPPQDAKAWAQLRDGLEPLVRLIESVHHAKVPPHAPLHARRGASPQLHAVSAQDGTAPLARDTLLGAAPRRTHAGFFVAP